MTLNQLVADTALHPRDIALAFMLLGKHFSFIKSQKFLHAIRGVYFAEPHPLGGMILFIKGGGGK